MHLALMADKRVGNKEFIGLVDAYHTTGVLASYY